MSQTKNSELITNFDDVVLPKPGTKPNSSGKNQAREDQTPNQFWLNVGLYRGEGDLRKLVSLPGGVAMDKLQARKIPSSSTQNHDFRNLRIAEKGLLEKIQGIMSNLKPGERTQLPLHVELYRIKEDEVVDTEATEGNPYAVGDIF